MPAQSPSFLIETVRPERKPGPLVLPLNSKDLLRGGREVLIRHGEHVYRLRHTRNDKLILTK